MTSGNLTGSRLAETRLLRRTGVDDRRHAALRDHAETVCVADREIVQAPLRRRIARDGEAGLVSLHVERRSVHQPHSDARITFRTAGKRQREVFGAGHRRTRRGKEHGVRRQSQLEPFRIDHVNPVGQELSEGMVRMEDGARLHGIVVAGQEYDRPAPACPTLEHLREASPPVLTWFGRVEDVAGPQDGVHGVLLGDRENGVRDIQAGTRQPSAGVWLELRRLQSEVQVGRVQELQHGVPAISNRTSSTRVMSGLL